MEIGIGLIIGVGVGILAGLLVIVASRKKKPESEAGKNAGSVKPATAPAAPDRRRPTTTVGADKTAPAETINLNTKVVPAERSNAKSETRSKPAPAPGNGNGNGATAPNTSEREAQLGVMMSEMRELILQLAEIVGKTGSASGEAEGRIANIKGNLLKITDSTALCEAKAMLLGEVDKMAKTNAALKQQLNEAQNGIANQKAQIEELQSTVRIDFLTKLPNRTAFDERLNEALYRYNRMSEPFSLLMLDIDYFKNVNDTYGHVNGDRILKGVAMKIKEAVRTDDFAARFGGEEFVVILPNTVDKVALGVAERLRESIERTKFRLDDKTINITISGGIAQCGLAADTDTIIDSSDKALYRAKVEGRNRIFIYQGGKTNTAVDKYRKEHHVRPV